MRILLTTDLYKPAINGVVTSTVSLKKSLEDLGHEVRVLTLADQGYINKTEHIYAVSSVNANKIYPGARVKLFSDRAIMHNIMDWRPDLIHTQIEFSTFRMAKKIAHYLDIPIVHTYHTIYEDYTHYFSPSKITGRKIVSLLTKRVLSDVEAVIAPTQKVDNILENYGVTQPISVIPTGIQLERFQKPISSEVRQAIRAEYGIPEDTFLLISLGRLGKEKNIEEILTFLSLIKQKVHFLIVGDGPNRENLINKVDELGLNDYVHFTGMVSPLEVAKYYQVSDLFVCASTSETQGLTYIEALASGIPALCRADESIENVIINGQNGYQYHHFKDFESGLYALMLNKDLYTEMANESTKFVAQFYSSQAFGRQVEMVYEQAMESYHNQQLLEMQK